MKDIEKIEFVRMNYKKRLYMIVRYNDGSQFTKRLNKKDKECLFYALTNIIILNKYKEE